MVYIISFDEVASCDFDVGDRGYLVHNVVWIGLLSVFIVVSVELRS
jgi:hypothetical protein